MRRHHIALVLPLLALACSTPSDQAFCEHVLSMQMSQQGASGSPSADDLKLCIEHLPELQGRLGEDWDAFARCAVKAKTQRELGVCSPKLEQIVEEDRQRAQTQTQTQAESAVEAPVGVPKETLEGRDRALEIAKAAADSEKAVAAEKAAKANAVESARASPE